MKKSLFIVVLVAGLGFGYWWLADRGSEQAAGPAADALVRPGSLSLRTVADSIEALGTAKALEAVTITSRQTGKVETIHFVDNQAVAQGDILVELEAANERAALREAEVTAAEDERVLNHYLALIKTNAVSRTMLDEQKSKVAASKARVVAAEARLSYFIIRAPFAGVLGFRQVSPGALVEPGDAITTLDAIDQLKIEFTLPESWVGKLAVGDKVAASSEAFPDKPFSAQVASLGSRVDPGSRAVTVQALIDNREHILKPGMSLNLVVAGRQRQALMVAEEAVQQETEGRFVYLIGNDNIVERRMVETGVRLEGMIEIRSGLEQGQQVVVEGIQKIRPGAKVSLMPVEVVAP